MFIIKVICERGEGNEFKYNRGNFTILNYKYWKIYQWKRNVKWVLKL